ncbi:MULTISPECIES: hypothetical protein [unclassified Micromonospora]|uniref:hypothetical protein n=1 Tax=unclassified Micromonospora TaxID=2617518 RepID=UPI002FEFAA77
MYRSQFAVASTAAALALALAACGDSQPPSAASSAVASATTPAASASPSEKPASGAKDVVGALAAAGLPLSNVAEQDENTDPNDKLGRPGQYTSRASADVPGGDKDSEKYGIDRGLVVEVFATAGDADARSTFIQDALKNVQFLGTEYHYRPADQRVLVRLTGKVKPSQAKKFEDAVAKL